MVTSAFAEGETLRANGYVEVQLPDDDYVAFTILMDIIHGGGPRIPLELSFGLIVTVSTIVDKYELQDATIVFAKIWINRLIDRISHISEHDEADLYLWPSISWVFRNNCIFKEVIRKLVNQIKSTSNITLCDALPIPQQILDTMHCLRKVIFSKIFKEVASWVDYYRHKSQIGFPLCPANEDSPSSDCDEMVLGSYIWACYSCRRHPAPEAPYEDFSTSSLLSDIADLRVRSLCDHVGAAMYWEREGHGLP